MFRDFSAQLALRRGVNSPHSRRRVFGIWTFTLILTATFGCQKPTNTALTGEEYPHPGLPQGAGGGTVPTPALVKSVAKEISLTEETVLTVSNTTVTIPAGAVLEEAVASLSSYGGTFINTSSIVLQSEPVLLVISGPNGEDLPRSKIHKDLEVNVTSGRRASSTKLTMLFHESGGLSDALTTGISQTVLSPMLELVSGSTYKASFKIRPPRVAIVMAQTSTGGLPVGYDDFKLPPVEVTDLQGVADSPADVTLTWRSDSTRNQGFALKYTKASIVTAVCTTDDLIEADYDEEAEVYSYSVTGLDDDSEYTFKLCSSSFRDPVDLSSGESVSVTTPKRALAVLTNLPASPTNISALNVTVGGENLTYYRYAFLAGASDCSSATYSTWIAVSQTITDALSGDGTKKLCVLGRVDPSNDQLVPTTYTFVLDQTPPVFGTLPLVNDLDLSSQSAINLSEKNNTTVIVGDMDGSSGYDTADYSVTRSEVCSAALTYGAAVPTNEDLLAGPEASDWRVCVRLSDLAGNVTFGSSEVFSIDWTPPVFSSLPYANAALNDGYINNTEQTTSLDEVVGNVLPDDLNNYSESRYAVVSQLITCDHQVDYTMMTAPVARDAVFVSDGVYRVCVRLRDLAHNTTYGSSGLITVKKALPTFSSVALGLDVDNGFLSQAEHLLSNPLARSLVGASYDEANYALVTDSTDCEQVNPADYGIMPLTDDPKINTHNESYKVCVKLSDVAGNPPDYGESDSFKALLNAPTCDSVPLALDAADGYINSTEHLTNNPVVNGVDNPSDTAVNTRYAVISNEATCDASQVFSNITPVSSDAVLGVNGDYKICAEVTDDESQAGFCFSGKVTAVNNTIVFTSIDLIPPAADGYINAAEHLTDSDLAGNLVGEYYDASQYALVTATTDCDAGLVYTSALPTADSPELAIEGEDYKVCVELSDLAGNPKAYGSSPSFTFDTTAPLFHSAPLINAASDGFINASENLVASDILGAVSASDYVAEQFSLVSSGTTCGVPLSWSNDKPKANDSNFSSEGDYKVCIQLTDAAGNMAYGASDSINFDKTPPVFTSISLANGTNDTYINISDTASSLEVVANLQASDFTHVKYLMTTSSGDCESLVGYSSSVPIGSDFVGLNGDHKVCVELADDAKNYSFGSSPPIHVDTIAPLFSSLALGADTNDGYLSVAEHSTTNNLTGQLIASDYDAAEYSVVTSSTVCDHTIPYGSMPLGNDVRINTHEESYKVCVKLTDMAGNPADYGESLPFVALLSPPTCASVALHADAADGYINSTEHLNTVAVTPGIAGVGSTVSGTQYAIISASATCDGGQSFGGATPQFSDVIFGVNGSYKLCAQVSDMALQPGYCESAVVTVVNNTISFSSLDLSGPADDFFINAAEHSLNSPIASNLVGSQYDSVRYALVTNATACDESLSYGEGIPAADSLNISADGESYKVCAELSDLAGNPKAYGASASFVYDATPPVFTSFALANAAEDGFINGVEHVLTTDIAGSLSASGVSTVHYALVSSGTTCGFPLSWTASIPKANDALFTTVGEYKVCIQLRDEALNTTYSSSPDVFFDDEAPQFTSIDLAGSAFDGFINLADSSSLLDVTSSLTATGYSSVNYKVALHSVTCSSEASFGSTVPTGQNFSGLNGTYKVCVELLDEAGNTEYGSSSVIQVDTVPPSFSSIALAGDALDGSINASEHGSSSPLVSAASGSGYDVIDYALVTSSTACTSATGWSTVIPRSDSTDFVAVDSFKVCVKLSDHAGNPDAFGESGAIAFDDEAPSFTSLGLSGDAADAYLNQAERGNATSLIGPLSATGHSSATYKLVSSAQACDNSLTYSASINSNTTDITLDGDYKICVQLSDDAGNKAYGASSVITVDTDLPVFTSLSLSSDVLDGYLSSAEKLAASSLGGSLASSGGHHYGYAVVESSINCDGALTYGGMPNSDDPSLTTGNSYKICASVADEAGNVVFGASESFDSDFEAPSISGVTLSAAVLDGFLNKADESAATSLLGTVTVSGHDSLAYAVTDALTVCNSILSYDTGIPNTNSTSFNSEGSWKVCVQATDLAGNTSAYSESPSFTRDVTAPTSSLATSGSLDANTTVGSSTVINGTASDATTGLTAVLISIQEGTGSCFDEGASDFTAACPNWLAVSGTTSWSYTMDDNMLIKGQTYSVLAKASDAAGNEQTSPGSGSFSFTAAEASQLWSADISYDQSSGDDKALSGAVDSNGNLYVVGYHSGSDKNWLIKKFSRRGVEDVINWNKDVGDLGVDEIARSTAIDSSDNVYVVGSRYNGTDFDWMIKKYSSSGVEDQANWNMLINSGNGDDEALAVAVDSSDNVYVVGYGRDVAGVSTGEDVWIKKFQSNGSFVCEQKLDEGGASLSDRATSVVINNSSAKIYVTGNKTAAGSDQQIFIKRLRASDCSVEASATANSSGNTDYSTAVRLDSTGAVYISGVNSSNDDWWIQKYTASLTLSFDYNASISFAHPAEALAIDSSDRIYVGGGRSQSAAPNSLDAWLRQFNSSLVENTARWNKIYDGSGSPDEVTALVVTSGSIDADNIYMIGWSTNLVGASSGADWWVKKLAGP